MVFFKVSVSHSSFSRNIAIKNGGSVKINCDHAEFGTFRSRDEWASISFINCSFNENRAKVGAGMHIFERRRLVSDFGRFVLSDSCDVPTVTGFVFIELTNLKFTRNIVPYSAQQPST